MTEPVTRNVGSASHAGENKIPCESHVIYDYLFRRVPLPVTSFIALADASRELPGGENGGKLTVDILAGALEPAGIADDELSRAHMEPLLTGAFARVNGSLLTYASEKSIEEPPAVSLTVVLSDRERAFLGHVGNNRIYLLHEDRLYDLTPSIEGMPGGPPAPQSPTLFAMPSEEEAGPALGPPPPANALGVLPQFTFGYNEVQIVPGDVIILCSDGLWSTVTESEIIENISTALNVQRGASQLARLSFSRDSSDNATVLAWQYLIPGEKEVVSARQVVKKEKRESSTSVLIIALLVVLLAGIFAVGFAFGWRITDTIRKPQKAVKQAQKDHEEAKEKAAEEKKKAEQREATTPAEPQASTPQASTPAQQQAATPTATIKGTGVRMRETPDVNGKYIGMLSDGDVVVVLGQVTGADSMAWSKVRGKVKSGGQVIDAEGYIRNDFLK